MTLGYIVHYGSKPTIKRLQTEEEAPEIEAPPEPDEETLRRRAGAGGRGRAGARGSD
jgi:hypothetical protein